jgi:hypothetical protein
MDTNVWGPHGWTFIHTIALYYPDKPSIIEQDNMVNFFNNIGKVLPCPKCREHYNTNLNKQELKIASKSRDLLFSWTVMMHNKVNKQNNKKIWTVDEAMKNMAKLYESQEKCTDRRLVVIQWIIFFIIVIGILIIIYRPSRVEGGSNSRHSDSLEMQFFSSV